MINTEITVERRNGVFYIFLNGVLHCTCDSWSEVVEELEGIGNETY